METINSGGKKLKQCIRKYLEVNMRNRYVKMYYGKVNCEKSEKAI